MLPFFFGRSGYLPSNMLISIIFAGRDFISSNIFYVIYKKERFNG